MTGADSLESLYQQIILDHAQHPHGRGLREPYDGEKYDVNPTCGDELTVRVRLDGDGEQATILDISYEGQGCSISQASASVLNELLVGQTLATGLRAQEEFLHLLQGRGKVVPDEEILGDAVAFSGVAKYPARVKCALLAWMAWKSAVIMAVETKVAS